jgi:hypothetical protein
MRLIPLLISLPVLVGLAQASQPVLAKTMDATDATMLLAKSHALDMKCNILGEGDGQQLSDYVARAEISLAEKVSVSAARKAIASGREAGKSAACDDASRKLVGDVLAAAKTAVETPVIAEKPIVTAEPEKPETTALAVAEPAPQPAPVVAKPKKPIIAAKPVKLAKPVKIEKTDKPAKPVKVKSGLQGYAKVAETYYAAMKCGNMSRGQMSKLYKAVLASHQQAVANNSARDVRAMLRNAEARGGSKSCT